MNVLRHETTIAGTSCKYFKVEVAEDRGSHADLFESMGLSVGKTIGRGCYGDVKAVYCSNRKCLMALKVTPKKKRRAAELAKAIRIVRTLSHPHVIATLSIVETPLRVLYLMDLAAGGDLYDYVRVRRCLPENEARYFFSQVTAGVGYLHGRSIAHRDLKLKNILLDSNMTAKIADFDLVVDASKTPSTEYCGSYGYIAPEVVQLLRKVSAYNPIQADIWSVGIILVAMVSGQLPILSEDHLFNHLSKEEGEEEEAILPLVQRFTDSLQDLICGVLKRDPHSRLTSRQVAEHEWLREAGQ